MKKKCRSRQSISPAERLTITLRYLATGDSQQSQSYNFRVGRATVCHIIRDTCEGIWKALKDTYMKAPESIEDWVKISNEFESQWNFPHCLGCLDGKHIAMQCPKDGGSLYYNYKGFHSIVLMAMCDANYCFTLVDIGNYGGVNDASIFNSSEMGQAFAQQELDIPGPKDVNGHTLPYVIVADDIFKLTNWMMKPYTGRNLSEENLVFNYRLSRCRRTIENAFGIMASRWQVFRRQICASVETVERVAKACVTLHNYLLQTDNACYVPSGFVDSVSESGDVIPGSWRSDTQNDLGGLQSLTGIRSNNYTNNAKEIRENFKTYFNSSEGSIDWQLNHVRSTGKSITSNF